MQTRYGESGHEGDWSVAEGSMELTEGRFTLTRVSNECSRSRADTPVSSLRGHRKSSGALRQDGHSPVPGNPPRRVAAARLGISGGSDAIDPPRSDH